MNSMVISGTPRTNSIKPTDSTLIKNILDCRPRANKIPIGNEIEIEETPIKKASRKPPNLSDSTETMSNGRKDCSPPDTYPWIANHQTDATIMPPTVATTTPSRGLSTR